MTTVAVPEGWGVKPIGDPSVATINPSEKLTKADTYPFIPMDAVADRFGGVKYLETITETSGGFTRFRDGDILLAKITPCVENGKAARISGLGDALGLGSTEFHVIRPSDATDGDYLYYLISSGMVHKLAVSLMEGTTGRQRIPASIFKRRLAVPIALDKEEQRRIANVLGKVDATMDATQASITAAQKLKQALMQNLLTGKLKPDGTWRREDEFYIDPKFGRVPKRWSVIKGKALFRIHGSTASKDSRGEPLGTTCLFMKVEDFNTPANDPFIVETECAFEPPSPKPVYPCKPGWIVVAKRGAAISHNRVRMLARESVLDPNLMAIEMLGEHSPEYFRYVLLLERLDRFSEVSSIPQLNNKDLYPRSFVMPPPDEQPAILQAIESVEEVVQRRIEKLSSLEKLKASLMQNLLTGKIRIPAE